MVDFHSDAMVTTPSWEILKLLALEKRENLMLAIEFYFKNKYLGSDVEQDTNIIRGRLWCLYYELEAWLIRTYATKEINEVKRKIDSRIRDDAGNPKEVFEAASFINKFMDDKKLTRIDNIKSIDRTRVELENEADE